MNIVKTEEHEREIKEGENATCPFCNSEDYIRDIDGLDGDYSFFDCHCEKCGNDFRETFVLRFQNCEK